MNMRQDYSLVKRLMTAIVVLLAFTFTSITLAQNKPSSDTQQQPMGVTVIKVKPGMDLEWENFLKKDLIPIMKKGGTKWLGVSKTNVFGKDTIYLFLWPIQDMAELDGPDPISKAMGPDGLALVLSNMQRIVASNHTFLMNTIPDLSIPPKQGYEVKMGVLATVSVTPGRSDEYIKRTKELVAAIGKTNAKAVMSGRVGLGGNPNDFISFVAFDSFADLGQFPQSMAKVMEETKLSPEAGLTTHIEYTVLKMAPELGIQEAVQ
jgi:hypothetical protein